MNATLHSFHAAKRSGRVQARAVLIGLIFLGLSAHATLPDENLRAVRFEQRLNQSVSLSLPFTDDRGIAVTLGDCIRDQPAVLVLGYYDCPMLCHLALNGLVEGLRQIRPAAGKDFSVVFVGIDPAETPDLAAAKKRAYLKRYGRPESEPGWRFLTGDERAITTLADETGFRFAYDAALKQYAHPSGAIVLTPQGRISGYLEGVSFPGNELFAALTAAASNRIQGPARQIPLLCYFYQPLTGKYSAAILTAVRAGGVLTVLALAFCIVRMVRNERAGKPSAPEKEAA